jgi:cation:H+ antiporter
LLVVFIAYIAFLIYMAKKHPTAETDEKKLPVWKSLLLIVIGIACIVIGGQLVVENAKSIAAFFGMSETLIGLTIVAFGTSLPELVTSVVASRKGENGLAVGNVVGSNIFNLMFILGVSAMIHPVAVNLASMFDLIILIGISLMAFLFCANDGKIERNEGLVMVAVYAADMAFAILR